MQSSMTKKIQEVPILSVVTSLYPVGGRRRAYQTMGSCLGTPKVSKEAKRVDLNHDGLIQKTELAKFIARNEKLYMMLSVNLQLPVEKCQEIATNVAFQMSKRSNPNASLRDLSEATKQREPTLAEFNRFLGFLEEPRGQQEFFHRTVFSTFDLDGSGYIEPHELDNFLDIFYQAGSIFAGDARLPKKSTLKKEVMKQLDTNRDGKLEFTELRTLISGGARAGLSFKETDDEMDSYEAKIKKKTSKKAEGEKKSKKSKRK
jgi:Ca2+-binding EF-hand superfamily protein